MLRKTLSATEHAPKTLSRAEKQKNSTSEMLQPEKKESQNTPFRPKKPNRHHKLDPW